MLTTLTVLADREGTLFNAIAGQKMIDEVIRPQIAHRPLYQMADYSLLVGGPVHTQVASRVWDQLRENMGELWGGQ